MRYQKHVLLKDIGSYSFKRGKDISQRGGWNTWLVEKYNHLIELSPPKTKLTFNASKDTRGNLELRWELLRMAMKAESPLKDKLLTTLKAMKILKLRWTY